MTPQDHAARGWPSFSRVPHMVQQAPGVWVRAVHVAPSVTLDPVEIFLNPREGIEKFVGQVVDRVATDLLAGQEPLGAEFEAVWDANVRDLYETDAPPFIPPAEMIGSGFPVPRSEALANALDWPLPDKVRAVLAAESADMARRIGVPFDEMTQLARPWTSADGGVDEPGRRWPLDDVNGDGA
jgi:hypothetical protein